MGNYYVIGCAAWGSRLGEVLDLGKRFNPMPPRTSGPVPHAQQFLSYSKIVDAKSTG
jgi:hypothetical protein